MAIFSESDNYLKQKLTMQDEDLYRPDHLERFRVWVVNRAIFLGPLAENDGDEGDQEHWRHLLILHYYFVQYPRPEYNNDFLTEDEVWIRGHSDDPKLSLSNPKRSSLDCDSRGYGRYLERPARVVSQRASP